MSYMRVPSGNSDGFKLYRILEILNPQLRQSKEGTHTCIDISKYSNVKDDGIYKFLNQY